MSLIPLLIMTTVLESFGVLVNLEAIMPLFYEQLEPSSPFPFPRKMEEGPRVVLLGSKNMNFEARQGRQVGDIWFGTNEPNYDINYHKSIGVLRNPVTLDSEPGEDACVPSTDWQKRFYPTCNSFHEQEFRFEKNSEKAGDGSFIEFLGAGTSRDAWKITKNDDSMVFKTLQVNRKFSSLTYHFQMIDAIAAERLTSSPYVTGIHGFCGMSVLNELGKELELDPNLTRVERLHYARDLAAGMAAAHGIDGAKNPRLVHADLRHSNVMFSQETGALTLSDFNQGYFLGWDKVAKKPCGYRPRFSFWHDRFAAPEECLREVQTEKTDIYHLGGMIFYFLTGYKPYTFNQADFEKREMNKKMPGGKWVLPTIPPRFTTSDDPAVVTMIKAIKACLHYEAKNRPNAREVLWMLDSTLSSVGHR